MWNENLLIRTEYLSLVSPGSLCLPCYVEKKIYIYITTIYNEVVVGQGHKGVTVTRRLWVRSHLGKIKCLFKFIFPFLRSGVEA